MMEKSRMYPPGRNALAAAFTETVGGAGIVLGAGMPLATAAVTSAIATAYTEVHKPNEFWNSNGRYEFNLTLAAGATALTIDGPGPLSVDAVVGKHRWGAFWGLLGAGARGARVVVRRRTGPRCRPIDSSGRLGLGGRARRLG